MQFSLRLITNLKHYLKLRKISNFEILIKVIVSDKIFQTVNKETAPHISVCPSDSWFILNELKKKINLFFTSKGKNIAKKLFFS